MSDAYATDKLLAHPEAIAALRAGGSKLTTVHLMPQNVCNQRCSFCSYRLPDNKNSEAFDERAHLSLDHLSDLCIDFDAMGVQGVEVTGGGEPLAHPNAQFMWTLMAHHTFATALVTNGTLMTEQLARLIGASGLKWARVSIDAGTPETYAKMRKTPEAHFEKAWNAVRLLREHAPDDPDFRLGVGFVLCNENVDELPTFIARARDSGADNVRLSLTFSDRNREFFDDPEKVSEVAELSKQIAATSTDAFTIHNQIPQRWYEVTHPTQDYRRCPTKDLLCVIEGRGDVYTCCTFTGSLKGRYGNIEPDGFRALWEKGDAFRRNLDASKYCTCACLYRDRNLAMNRIIDSDQIHTEFI